MPVKWILSGKDFKAFMEEELKEVAENENARIMMKKQDCDGAVPEMFAEKSLLIFSTTR